MEAETKADEPTVSSVQEVKQPEVISTHATGKWPVVNVRQSSTYDSDIKIDNLNIAEETFSVMREVGVKLPSPSTIDIFARAEPTVMKVLDLTSDMTTIHYGAKKMEYTYLGESHRVNHFNVDQMQPPRPDDMDWKHDAYKRLLGKLNSYDQSQAITIDDKDFTYDNEGGTIVSFKYQTDPIAAPIARHRSVVTFTPSATSQKNYANKIEVTKVSASFIKNRFDDALVICTPRKVDLKWDVFRLLHSGYKWYSRPIELGSDHNNMCSPQDARKPYHLFDTPVGYMPGLSTNIEEKDKYQLAADEFNEGLVYNPLMFDIGATCLNTAIPISHHITGAVRSRAVMGSISYLDMSALIMQLTGASSSRASSLNSFMATLNNSAAGSAFEPVITSKACNFVKISLDIPSNCRQATILMVVTLMTYGGDIFDNRTRALIHNMFVGMVMKVSPDVNGIRANESTIDFAQIRLLSDQHRLMPVQGVTLPNKKSASATSYVENRWSMLRLLCHFHNIRSGTNNRALASMSGANGSLSTASLSAADEMTLQEHYFSKWGDLVERNQGDPDIQKSCLYPYYISNLAGIKTILGSTFDTKLSDETVPEPSGWAHIGTSVTSLVAGTYRVYDNVFDITKQIPITMIGIDGEDEPYVKIPKGLLDGSIEDLEYVKTSLSSSVPMEKSKYGHDKEYTVSGALANETFVTLAIYRRTGAISMDDDIKLVVANLGNGDIHVPIRIIEQEQDNSNEKGMEQLRPKHYSLLPTRRVGPELSIPPTNAGGATRTVDPFDVALKFRADILRVINKSYTSTSNLSEKNYISNMAENIFNDRWCDLMNYMSELSSMTVACDYCPVGFTPMLVPHYEGDNLTDVYAGRRVSNQHKIFVYGTGASSTLFNDTPTNVVDSYAFWRYERETHHTTVNVDPSSLVALAMLGVSPDSPADVNSAISLSLDSKAFNHDVAVMRCAARYYIDNFEGTRYNYLNSYKECPPPKKMERFKTILSSIRKMHPPTSPLTQSVEASLDSYELRQNHIWKGKTYIDAENLVVIGTNGPVDSEAVHRLSLQLPFLRHRPVIPLNDQRECGFRKPGLQDMFFDQMRRITEKYCYHKLSYTERIHKVLVRKDYRLSTSSVNTREGTKRPVDPPIGAYYIPDYLRNAPITEGFWLYDGPESVDAVGTSRVYDIPKAMTDSIDGVTSSRSHSKVYSEWLVDGLKAGRSSVDHIVIFPHGFLLRWEKMSSLDSHTSKLELPELNDGLISESSVSAMYTTPDMYVGNPVAIKMARLVPTETIPIVPKNVGPFISRFAERNKDWPFNCDYTLDGALTENTEKRGTGNTYSDTSNTYNHHALGVIPSRRDPIPMVDISSTLVMRIDPIKAIYKVF